MLRRTPALGLLFGVLLAAGVNLVIQDSARPFTFFQQLVLLLVAVPPGVGLALFLDPYSRRMKEEYLKVDFYEEQD